MSVRLYGERGTYSSRAQVGRGFEAVLQEQGLLAGFYATNEPEDEDRAPPPGAMAPIAVHLGTPNSLFRMTFGARHEHRLAMLVANSTLLPKMIMESAARHCTGLIAPSDWAVAVLRELTALPVNRVRHGIADEFAPVLAAPAPKRHLLHCSTSAFSRKGTVELVRAWEMLESRGETEDLGLKLLLDYEAEIALRRYFIDRGLSLPASVSFVPRGLGDPRGLPPEAMRLLYLQAAALVQPSRAEGFGLQPLEARACGVPVVQTLCTGHRDHLARGLTPEDVGVVQVEHGPDVASDDCDGALAPEVTPDAVAAALRKAIPQLDVLRENARRMAGSVAAAWRWSYAMGDTPELVSMLRGLA